jgi:hypothetical protein
LGKLEDWGVGKVGAQVFAIEFPNFQSPSLGVGNCRVGKVGELESWKIGLLVYLRLMIGVIGLVDFIFAVILYFII